MTNIIALRLKSCRAKPSYISIPSFHKFSLSYIRGSVSMPGCLGPCISTDSKRYFLFWHNHIGRLYIISINGHVLWVLLLSPNGFIPSVLNANRTFLGSFQIPDSTCHRIPSTAEHQLDVGAFRHPSYAYLNPTITSAQHLWGSRRNASDDQKLGGTT